MSTRYEPDAYMRSEMAKCSLSVIHQSDATIIHRLTHPPLHQRYLQAIAAGHHYAAWRLPCGREVLCLPGRVCVWHPNPRDGVEVWEGPMGTEESPADVIRRLDTTSALAPETQAGIG